MSRQDITSVLDACPNHDWRMIVALARYGGLRCPTEVLSVRWQDINWEKGRIIVTSPKTEHHPDGGTRVIPLFPELKPELEKAFELAPEGAVFVVDEKFRKAANGENGWLNANLRTTFQKIIKRAGLVPWPRPFQNLRASRETELVERFPIQTVTSWLGNSPRIAMKHYLQTTETHFENALKADPETTHSATQSASEMRRNRSQVEREKCKNPEKTGVSRGSNALKVAGTGFEPATSRL
ncbi:site-specific integrase [Gimesia maris]|uniref:site-specific integrase n=1 Tax=Gimesia maris TaxID=122 RepID=UPI003A8E563A